MPVVTPPPSTCTMLGGWCPPQHRYYGVSMPANGSDAAAMRFLSVDQALSDYVHLIQVGGP